MAIHWLLLKYFRDSKGESHSNTEWHSVVLRRTLADLAAKYLKKVCMIYLEGKIKTRSYDDKEGNKRYVTRDYW